jgi:hypothetical protein
MKKTSSQLFLSPICICALACILMACKLPAAHTNASGIQVPTTPTSSAFTEHTGDGYTISYPSGWQFSTNTTNAGNYQGDYFTDPTNAYAFHVYPSQDQTSPSTILNQLLTNIPGSQRLNIAPDITVNGIVWQQGKVIRLDQQTGKQQEIMGWVAKNPVAAQQIPYFVLHADGPYTEGSPNDFDRYTTDYFLPMLRTFHFTNSHQSSSVANNV